ncbi:MAG: MFS transporter [Dehalococcoidia bacterium]|nr:MFS transporter [Dehalococcoidia bacterium]
MHTHRGRIFYGYYLLAVTFLFLVLFNGSGVFAFSLFVRPLEASLGWGRGEVMAGFTVFYATTGFASPLAGRFVDRYGARPVIAVGALMMGLGFVLVSRISSLPLFYLGYMIIGTGGAAMGPVPCSAVISYWFKRKRGTALGLMSAGIGAGGVVVAPFIGYMLSHYDWRMAYLSLGVLIMAITIPLALLLIRTRPSEKGLYPDGAKGPVGVSEDATRRGGEREGTTLKHALHTGTFWFIAIAFTLFAFGSMGALQASVPFLEDIGYPTATAAAALGAIGFGSAVGKILFGWMCDKMAPNHAFAVGAAFLLAGVLILLTVHADSPLAIIWTYALLLGLGAGAWLPTLSMLASTRFGLLHYGAVFGALNLCLSLGTASGPLFAGMMYDATGSYFAAFTIFAGLLALAIPIIFMVRKPAHSTRL